MMKFKPEVVTQLRRLLGVPSPMVVWKKQFTEMGLFSNAFRRELPPIRSSMRFTTSRPKFKARVMFIRRAAPYQHLWSGSMANSSAGRLFNTWEGALRYALTGVEWVGE